MLNGYISHTAFENKTRVVFRSIFAPKNKTSYMVLPISVELFEKGLTDYANGALVQDAFPTLGASQREILMTGLGDNAWDDMFSEEGIEG